MQWDILVILVLHLQLKHCHAGRYVYQRTDNSSMQSQHASFIHVSLPGHQSVLTYSNMQQLRLISWAECLLQCLQDPVSEVMAVMVKRSDVTKDVKISEQLRTQQEALQRCAYPSACAPLGKHSSHSIL